MCTVGDHSSGRIYQPERYDDCGLSERIPGQVIEAMIRFMYVHDYDGSGSSHDRLSPMSFNTNVYGAMRRIPLIFG